MSKPNRRLPGACNLSIVLALTALLFAGVEVRAQCPAGVVAGGLQGPIGITRSNQGSLLVSEVGTPTPNHLVLQFSTNMLAGAPGSLLRFETPTGTPAVVADCLITPTSMALDEKTGTLYVTELATGRVVSLQVE